MAKKGQKFKKHVPELKEAILNEYFSGSVGYHFVAKKYGLPTSTLWNWIVKVKHPEIFKNTKRGRPKAKALTLEDYKERYEILKKYQAFLQARREKK